MKSTLPKCLIELDQWVNHDDGKRPIPSIHKPGTYARARERDPERLGFVFTDHDPYTGIDIDAMTPLAQAVLSMARERSAFVQRSPGGAGWHIIGRGSLRGRGIGKGKADPGVEVYSRGRYFTMCPHPWTGDPNVDIQDLIDAVESKLPTRAADSAGQNGNWDDSYLPALKFHDPEVEDSWVRVGMALAEAGAPFEVWERWSCSTQKGAALWTDGERDPAKEWARFESRRGTPGNAGLGSIVQHARAHGWVEAEELFEVEADPDKAARPKRGWFRSASELGPKARAPDWVAEGLIERGQLALVLGHRSVGKSFLAFDLAAHVSEGRDWFGRPTSGCEVAYFIGEWARGFIARIKLFERERFCVPRVLVTRRKLDLATEAERAEFRRMLLDLKAERPGLGMVVLDTFAKYVVVEANAPKEISQVMRALEHIAAELKVAIVFLTHVPKAEREVTDPFLLTARGTSALEDDTHVIIAATPTEHPGLKTFALTRAKDVATGFSGHYRIGSVPMFDHDTVGLFEPVDQGEAMRADEEQRETERERLVAGVGAATLAAGREWVSWHQVWDALGKPVAPHPFHQGNLRAKLNELVELGRLESCEDGARNARRAAVRGYRPVLDDVLS